MKFNGNDIATLMEKLLFMCIPTSRRRTIYILKHKQKFHHIGDNLFWQPRKFPADPELISIGNNVKIASGVIFVNHDILHNLFNCMEKTTVFKPYEDCIKIGDNVMLGANAMILPGVSIGSNVVVAAGSIVTKDLPNNGVYGGCPAKEISYFPQLREKRRKITGGGCRTLLA